ncbi:PREDICTED: speckle targeted PIP5K1A-regulated poly(A) polymerase-like [Thamnophis sirtalis]|uniref:Speckle targeted PIP5K1A-regulated poly(A) polymerase-like n=1 Tax=Thamnophis sirtalis TaxID=35019 RepID=A0A6I9XRP7_9SAUR|nr:PREDICTED: speckle targeted PIP5K1A-regulated poly(A) polymerase-like [Thamnophis sirtalis]
MIKELKNAVKDYGITSHYSRGLLNSLAGAYQLLPQDWKDLARMLLNGTQYVVFESEYKRKAMNRATRPGAQWTMEQLFREGAFATLLTQAQALTPLAFSFVNECVMAALSRVDESGTPIQSFSAIKQTATESYSDFINRLQKAVERQISNKEAAAEILMKLAFEHANADCQSVLKPLASCLAPTLADYLKACCSLLAEFFRIFESYNFTSGVISLREGRLLPLPDFLLSDAGQKFKVGPINLQDPFELSHNVAANVNEKTALRLQRSCQDAAKYCRSLQYQRKSSKGKSWGLVRLFQPGSSQAPEHLVILLPLTPATQSRSELHPSRDSSQLPFRRVCAGISYVLQHVLKCSCSENPQGPGDDGESFGSDPEEDHLKTKTEQLSVGSKRSLDLEDAALGAPPAKKSRMEVSLPDTESVSWDCAAWHRVWLGRRRVRRQFSSPQADPKTSADPLELEGKVSEAISQQEGQTRPVDPLFGFNVCATIKDGGSGEQDPQVNLNFTPDPEQGGVFQDFFHFLQCFLPRMVEQYLATKQPPDLCPPEEKSSPPVGDI